MWAGGIGTPRSWWPVPAAGLLLAAALVPLVWADGMRTAEAANNLIVTPGAGSASYSYHIDTVHPNCNGYFDPYYLIIPPDNDQINLGNADQLPLTGSGTIQNLQNNTSYTIKVSCLSNDFLVSSIERLLHYSGCNPHATAADTGYSHAAPVPDADSASSAVSDAHQPQRGHLLLRRLLRHDAGLERRG